MAKIARYTGNLAAFASGALGTERTVFGDVTQSDTLDDNVNADFLRGWEVGVDANGFPPKQYFNAIGFTATQLIAYLFQMGTPEWDSAQEYHIGSIATVNGVQYRSLTNSNTGNNPTTDQVNWAKASGGLDWMVKATAYTASDGEGVLADTSGGAFSITLPASPQEGETVAIADYVGTFNTYNCTIDRNGSNIEGLAANLVLNSKYTAVTLVYTDATEGWVRVQDKDSAAKGAGGDHLFYENDQVMTADYTIAGDKNASITGPFTINTGVTLTIETGATLVVN